MIDANGIIRIDTSTTPPKGVEIRDLQVSLGRGTSDLGLLCSDQEYFTLPYQRVEYLQSSGTQYINTGLKPQADDEVEITFKYVGEQSTILFGCRTSSSSGKFCIGSGTANTLIYASLGSASNITVGDFDTNEHTVILNVGKGKASMDGSAEVSVGTFAQNDLNIYLFVCNQAGTVSYKSTARIMSVKIGNRAHFYPVRHNGVGYMYDVVSGQLFGNAGTGSFTYGDDVNEKVTRRANKINKWAKYKPIKRSGLSFNDQLNPDFTWKTDQDTGGPATWWKNTDGQCGLTFTTYNNIGSLSSGFLHDLITTDPSWALAWGYDTPTGGINSYPYRIFDFNEYDRNALKPVTGVFDNLRLVEVATNNYKVTVQLVVNRGDARSVQLSDLSFNNSSINGWYVGILLYKSSSTGEWAYAFSTSTLGSGNGETVEITGLSAGLAGHNVKIVPFLSSVRWNQGGTVLSGTFVSCDVEPQEVRIAAPASNDVVADISAYWRESLHHRVHYDVKLTNGLGTSATITNLRIGLFEDNVEVDYTTVATFTLANAEEYLKSGTLQLNNTTFDSSKTYKIVVTYAANGANKSADKEVEEPRQY